ncbi:hypothetical protein [Paenibacillus durus]|uniref:Uncharacterized protein n=1 Tax=Paenibacillus durus TaxID=44251 RepID=A0A089HG55_PAEDU|nr:hypothetical protein [Paenibacillus durus]AIQ10886.1 hypothetical protein PDUR_01765 [Paenibacillus durus]
MKKYLVSSIVAAALMFSLGTSAFAANGNESATKNPNLELGKKVQNVQELEKIKNLDANNLEKIAEVLDNIEVSKDNPVVRHEFEDGSAIVVSINVTPTLTSKDQSLVTTSSVPTNTPYTASVTMSGESVITGGNMWVYTLNQTYKTDGSKITWHEASPYGTFDKVWYSLWGVDSETLSVTDNPGYPGGIWATGTVKLSWDIWEGSNIQPINIKLTLSIKGDGTYTGYTARL